ncbi:PREDICTED: uncharacterized protein LOC104819254 [Tarenaya hassleriana]|uniref:uncharacterized protein LOC104819254 n=1 Tax=Tarenaya hassleriana TaxID=28532 RepID=UPI00053C4865|nr:PREDICTED: uncharacterized protein LOC104819254 [Tarenaya hassleriana]XP_010547544.1 PREDICTED: uncharacterized protein LOC104819254 [Tarenaya hassleriana]
MPTSQHFIRIDTFQLKSQIKKKIGRAKTENYLDLLSRFLSSKLSKSEFDKLCIATVGKENIHLHNALLTGIIKNICLSKTPPGVEASLGNKKEVNGFQRSNSFQSLCKDLPLSPRKGRTPNRRIKDSKGKSQVTEVFSSGGRPPCSIEEGEEVDQSTLSPGTHSENRPIEAPLGVSFSEKIARQRMISRRLLSCSHMETCYSVGQLPDTVSLKKKLEQTLGVEGVEVSVGFTNLLNMGLDVFLKRLIKPCLELAASRSSRGLCSGMAASNGLCSDRYSQETRASLSASMMDFQVAMELNPSILGEDWPAKLEKFLLLGTED